jgi:hypothetical protein
MNQPTELQISRGALVHQEMREHVQRLSTEGFEAIEILSGLAALMNDIVAGASNQATASAYFFGLAKSAAHLAAEEMGLKKD